ncbi:hypothetical protein [Terrihabitans rhizophilus]|uniref:Uncharacterized protein n=1 Tax=Terrihabitans rhizophilus TaxID=3092662 RepID=A0ABU4RNB3_9HYPH|nr:hypothetical protein [Terrihabitans sp. PJ23]MDX6806317.1 hypothetical protein [Terrihabitans sp. PJ23]
MSLARIALRIAAVEAIKGRTLVEDNVLDSPNGALDIQANGTLRTPEDRPFVAVFTDTGKAEDITGRSLVENGVCELVIESGISLAMTVVDQETGASEMVGVSIPASDGGFEFFLDIVQREIVEALTDPNNEWAEIYRRLHYRVTKIEIGARRTTDDGQRVAGHQVRISVALMDDPVRGEPLEAGSPLADFLDKLQASDSLVYQEQAATMRRFIEGSAPNRTILQRRQGLTAPEMAALAPGVTEDDAGDA